MSGAARGDPLPLHTAAYPSEPDGGDASIGSLPEGLALALLAGVPVALAETLLAWGAVVAYVGVVGAAEQAAQTKAAKPARKPRTASSRVVDKDILPPFHDAWGHYVPPDRNGRRLQES